MLIVGDEGHYNGRFPWVTASLIVINVVVYVAQVFIGPAFTLGYALVPGELPIVPNLVAALHHNSTAEVLGPNSRPEPARTIQQSQPMAINDYRPAPVLTLFTSMFLHADVFHLIGNMWFLLVFGRNVECAMNHGVFLAFYGTCGAAAGLAHAVSDPFSFIPYIGASGAISGIMGAYISIHPFNNIKVWIVAGVLEIPALVVLGIWLVLNYLSAIASLESDVTCGGVAYWAHLGGFAAGFVIVRTLVLCLQCKRLVAGSDAKPATNAKTADDPFATFISVQTVRKMQSKEEQENH